MHHVLLKKLLVILALHGSATFDAWSTRRYLQRVPGAHELNPLMRPFAGNWSSYVAVQGDALVTDFLLLKKSRTHPKLVKAAVAFTLSEHLGFGIIDTVYAPALRSARVSKLPINMK